VPRDKAAVRALKEGWIKTEDDKGRVPEPVQRVSMLWMVQRSTQMDSGDMVNFQKVSFQNNDPEIVSDLEDTEDQENRKNNLHSKRHQEPSLTRKA
jgi:hypothetical protein